MSAKPVPNCPKCKEAGSVISHRKQFVTLECPKCKGHWKTLSKTCPKCNKPNGYAVEGTCRNCYSGQRG
jgi:DnaJ-class molecular chaperone